MTKVYDTYGVSCADLESAMALVSTALSIEFQLHESLYWGGEYYLATSERHGAIAIRPNHNKFTGKLNEPDSAAFNFIITVSRSADPDSVGSTLIRAGLVSVRRTIV
jgi:hypothetical protein